MNRPAHFEVLTANPEASSAFYADVFGWTVATWGEGEQGYWLATTGDDSVPGINGGFMGPHFEQRVINTIMVESLDAMIAKVEGAGGKKVHGPNDVPGVGLHAYCSDPDGTLFGLMQPVAAE